MRRPYSIFSTFLALFFVQIAFPFILQSASWDYRYSACEWRQYGTWMQVEADFLYWKPCVSNIDIDAVLSSGDEETAKYRPLCPTWEPGLKIGVFLPKIFGAWHAAASYYRVHSTSLDHEKVGSVHAGHGVFSPMLFPQSGFTGPWRKGKESSDLSYNEWDLVLTYDLIFSEKHILSPYFGLAGIILEHEVEGKFYNHENSGPSATAEWNMDLSGVGVRVGGQYQYTFCPSLRLAMNANISLLEGNDANSNVQTFQPISGNPTILTFNDDSCSHPIYGYHLAVKLLYTRVFCERHCDFVLGYEFVTWGNLPNPRVFFEDAGSNIVRSSSSRKNTLSFHGPVLGCAVRF